MYIIPLVFIIFGLVAGIIIVGRKLPLLAQVDVDTLPKEREARKKKELMDRRVMADKAKLQVVWQKWCRPVIAGWQKLQRAFRSYVARVERLWHHEERVRFKQETIALTEVEKEQKISSVVQEAERNLHAGQLNKAEEMFIAAIKLDSKSAGAYSGLGDTYVAQQAYKEAKETYQFLLQLTPDDDKTMVKIAELAEAAGNLPEAIHYYQGAAVLNDSLSPRFYHLAELLVKLGEPLTAKEAIVQAVELEPKNPKYLDLLIEIGVLCGDKELASMGFNELRLVNPQNQKLLEFQERIRSLT